MTGYDLFAIVVILASAAAGWIRGGLRELVTLAAFAVAAIISLLALPLSGPVGRALVDPDWAGSIAAAIVVFLIVYFGIRITGTVLSRRLRDHKQLSGVDRLFGIGVGAARALVLLGAIHLVAFAATAPNPPPGWLRDAALFPVSHASARAIQTILPTVGRGADALSPVIGSSVRDGFSDDDTATPQSSASAAPDSP
ncbi:MAG: membrane protein required for colicin V production [Brevundimonas sp.]|uniref:CvpA family protein n=1 Tax=Brevundimonas sp. TaxID=1871086 RepID=UPI0039E3A747